MKNVSRIMGYIAGVAGVVVGACAVFVLTAFQNVPEAVALGSIVAAGLIRILIRVLRLPLHPLAHTADEDPNDYTDDAWPSSAKEQ